jgi:hypothetical protein
MFRPPDADTVVKEYVVVGVKVASDWNTLTGKIEGVFIYAGDQVVYIKPDELDALIRKLVDINENK